MADISKIKLPNGTTYNIKDNRLPGATSSDENKVVTVDGSGNYIVAEPQLDGTSAYVTNTTLYIATGIQNGDGVGY